MTGDKTQADKFEDAARALECDDDPQRFRERVGKLVKHKPVARTVELEDEGDLPAPDPTPGGNDPSYDPGDSGG